MRIHLVRHGESEGNVKNWDYSVAGDHKVRLTQNGFNQARQAGVKLGKELLDRSLIYCSPFMRTRETLQCILDGAGVNEALRVYEDSRLRETDAGYENYEAQKEHRKVHGHYYYRFNGGESPADCSDRISSFLESMMRQVERKKKSDIVIVSHGLAIRCFVMRFLHMRVEEFEALANPHNCDIITIDLFENLSNPQFRSGRWAAEGLRLRAKEAEDDMRIEGQEQCDQSPA